MRHLLFPAVLILLFPFIIISCSKDEGGGTGPTVDLSKCRISRAQTSESIYTEYTYDLSGRIASIKEVDEDVTTVYSFEYVSATEVKVYENSRQLLAITLNAAGNATHEELFLYDEQNPTTVYGTVTFDHTYNAEGYLISSMQAYDGPGTAYTKVTTNTWTDGNLTSTKEVSSETGTFVTNYTYYTDKQNSLAYTMQHRDFDGKQCKNLIRSENGSEYSYEFDDAQRVIKETSTGGAVKTYTWK